MSSRQFARDLAYASGFAESHTLSNYERVKSLLDGPRIRGPYAPPITPSDAAMVVIGLACSDTATNAAQATPRYAELRMDDGAPITLRARLAALLADPAAAQRVARVTVCRSWPEAVIEYRDRHGRIERAERFADPSAERTAGARILVVLERAMLHHLAIQIEDQGTEGEITLDSPALAGSK